MARMHWQKNLSVRLAHSDLYGLGFAQHTSTQGTLAAGMLSIQELLIRIRWDNDTDLPPIKIKYYDRVMESLINIPHASMHFDPDNPGCVDITDVDGACHRISLHCIKAVYRDEELIWERFH